MCMGSSQPAPQPLPPKPTTDDSASLARVEAERMRAIAAQGRQSTIVTGGLGASDFGSAGGTRGATVLGRTG